MCSYPLNTEPWRARRDTPRNRNADARCARTGHTRAESGDRSPPARLVRKEGIQEGPTASVDRPDLCSESTAPVNVSVRFISFDSCVLASTLCICCASSDKVARSTGLGFGGPAVVELALGRPETLRRHLSVGLPLSESRCRKIPPLCRPLDVMHLSLHLRSASHNHRQAIRSLSGSDSDAISKVDKCYVHHTRAQRRIALRNHS